MLSSCLKIARLYVNLPVPLFGWDLNKENFIVPKELMFLHLFNFPRQRVVLLWALDPAERDALLANEATKRWTKSNQVLVEIACTRSSQQLLAARQAYHARFKKSLEEDVAYHTTGDFRKVQIN